MHSVPTECTWHGADSLPIHTAPLPGTSGTPDHDTQCTLLGYTPTQNNFRYKRDPGHPRSNRPALPCSAREPPMAYRLEAAVTLGIQCAAVTRIARIHTIAGIRYRGFSPVALSAPPPPRTGYCPEIDFGTVPRPVLQYPCKLMVNLRKFAPPPSLSPTKRLGDSSSLFSKNCGIGFT